MFSLNLIFKNVLRLGFACLLFQNATVLAAVTSVDLTNYQITDTYFLPPGDFSSNPAVINAHEVSAVTFNWDNNSLFVIGDEGGMILEVSFTGQTLNQMAVIGFNDPEGLAYVGDGKLVVVEERNRDAYQLTFNPGGFILKNSLTPIDLGSFVDNIGLEGVSYDTRFGNYITVKEKSPQEVNINTLDFVSSTAVTSPLFNPNSLSLNDIADVQVLGNVPSLAGTVDEDNLLIISQESSLLLEVDRAGNILSQLDLSSLPNSAEGVTIANDGTIYVVAENGAEPLLAVLKPIATANESDEDIPFMPLWSLGLLSLLFVGLSKVKRFSF